MLFSVTATRISPHACMHILSQRHDDDRSVYDMTTTTSTTTIAVSRPPSTSSFSAVYPGNDARYINNELDIRWVMQQCPSTVSHHPHLTNLTIINSSAVSCSYNPVDCTHLCSNHPYYNYPSIHPPSACMYAGTRSPSPCCGLWPTLDSSCTASCPRPRA